jgi:lipoprotein-releasing system ATP-binding protein
MAVIELIGVAKEYPGAEGGAPLKVIDGVGLKVEPGDSVAIVGRSGSGKSTLLQIMGALDKPTRGQVLFDGQDLARCDASELATVRNRQIGFMFQAHCLLPQLTLWENVLLPALAEPEPGALAAAEGRARKYVERVGLLDRLNHRPAQLSGGERQRAALARALVNGPRLLLADEPTGALDSSAAQNLANLLQELNREENLALVMVTHAPDLAARMRRGYRLHDGHLAPLTSAS